MTGREGAGGTPGTEAGRRLGRNAGLLTTVLAIEAEATRAERERIVGAVEGLYPVRTGQWTSWSDREVDAFNDAKSRVLAILRDTP